MPMTSHPRTGRANVEAVALGILIWIVYPLWLAAGLTDLWCHRRTSIETTAGPIESALHLAQLASVGLAVLAGLFLEVTTSVLLAMGLLILAHSVLSFIDVSYTDSRRYISPFEQHVHAYMEVLPWTSLALTAILHPQAIMAVSWAVRTKQESLPAPVLAAVLVPALLFAVTPAVAELASTLRHPVARHPSYGRAASA
jgi:hypothetical protein